jgi:hypothetical protein
LLRLLSFLGPLNIDRPLRRDFKCEGHAPDKEKEPVPHLSETESDILTSRGSRPRHRDLPR